MDQNSADALKNQLEVLVLSLRQCVALMEHDNSKYGEWQCNYSEWFADATKKINSVREQLGWHPVGETP